ncbi:pentapeptide repeat-containing protein [Clavibacter michiganensis subsp. phaseoli]|uniref:pentapeptide repeat-containing protein n=1 Tax=Clavibacter phaseoli TaxID=1734031 RepID=UPI001FB30EE6|nr:pentapeptide repeat-containing protein [Clavibacter phaseoli]MCJ1709816.1 pentapeptide repeat-containing protein [Clavibacter phaseoli]
MSTRRNAPAAGEIDVRGALLWPTLLAVYAVGSAVAVWVLPPLLVSAAVAGADPHDEALTLAERAAAVTAARQVVLLAAGGLLAVITLVLTQRRDAVARARHEIDRDANRTTRYTEAVKQLGDDKAAVRFGGIYALGRIAEDSDRDRGTISQVLVAYIREAAPYPVPIQYRSPKLEQQEPISAMIQFSTARAALEVVGVLSKLVGGTPKPLDLSRTALSGADLGGAQLHFADFSDSNMNGVILVDAAAKGAVFRDADLGGARMDQFRAGGADFARVRAHQASFAGAELPGADFTEADLTEANFADAKLNDAVLVNAELASTNFDGANLVDANFHSANLDAASFRGADLRNADLRGINGNGSIDFGGADLRGVIYHGDLADAGDMTGARFDAA